jgi:1-aminocyclopropane-1-carboxylate deaminase/D-cysteine desulfhydrase-like pyridoxal-dependent ACC family enzyme
VLFVKDNCYPFSALVEAATGATVAAAMSDNLKQMDPNMKIIGIIVFGGKC